MKKQKVKLGKLAKIAIAVVAMIAAFTIPWGEIFGNNSSDGDELIAAAEAFLEQNPTYEIRHTETMKVGKTKVTIAIIRDRERGVGTEYNLFVTDKGGVAITPRINADGSPLVTSTVTSDRK